MDPSLFGNPSIDKTFTDQMSNDYWRTDDAFAQRKLAGECPYSLRKVFLKGNFLHIHYLFTRTLNGGI